VIQKLTNKWNTTKCLNYEASKRVVITPWNREPMLIFEVLDTDSTIDEEVSSLRPTDRDFGARKVILIKDLTNNLLKEVFNRNDAVHTPMLIEHHRKMGRFSTELLK
jgi:hypothetical protein